MRESKKRERERERFRKKVNGDTEKLRDGTRDGDEVREITREKETEIQREKIYRPSEKPKRKIQRKREVQKRQIQIEKQRKKCT